MTAPLDPKNDWVAKNPTDPMSDWRYTADEQNLVAENIIWIKANGGAGGATNLTTARTATTVTVVATPGTDAVIPAADGANAGVMTAAQQTLLTGAIQASTKNAANGVAGLNASGQVAAAQLPSYVDDVAEYPDRPSFPATGETGKIYVAINTPPTTPSTEWRWSGTVYVQMVSSPGTTDAVTEGTTNLYYTNARADARVVAGITGKQPLNANLTAISALVDPNVDRLLFWDDSAGTWLFLTLGTNLSITETTLNATGGTGGGDASTNTTTSVDNEVVLFSGTGGKTLKRSVLSGLIKQASGVQSVAVAGIDYSIPAEIAAAQRVTINPQSGTSYTLALTDAGSKVVEMSNAAANTVIVPLNSTVAFTVGDVIEVKQVGAGQTTVAPVSGAVTINCADTLKLRKQWSSAYLRKRGTDSWVLDGDTI